MIPIRSTQILSLDRDLARHGEALFFGGYFSINDFYRPGSSRADDLRHLNAVFVDLDHRQLSGVTAMARVWDAVAREFVPPPSLIQVNDGGSGLFWVLRDEKDPGRPAHAWPEKVDLARRLQDRLRERLDGFDEGLVADAGCADLCRAARLPGSTHERTLGRVSFSANYDAGGNVVCYSLGALADFLGVGRKSARVIPLCRGEGSTAIASRVAEERLVDFERIGTGIGFSDGTRGNALFAFASLLHARGDSDEVVRGEVLRAARDYCRPPYSEGEAVARADSGIRSKGKWRDETLSRFLGVTPEIAKSLGLARIGRLGRGGGIR